MVVAPFFIVQQKLLLKTWNRNFSPCCSKVLHIISSFFSFWIIVSWNVVDSIIHGIIMELIPKFRERMHVNTVNCCVTLSAKHPRDSICWLVNTIQLDSWGFIVCSSPFFSSFHNHHCNCSARRAKMQVTVKDSRRIPSRLEHASGDGDEPAAMTVSRIIQNSSSNPH